MVSSLDEKTVFMPKKIKFLSQEDVIKCIDMPSAIDAMRTAFSELSQGNVDSPLRVGMELGNSDYGAGGSSRTAGNRRRQTVALSALYA